MKKIFATGLLLCFSFGLAKAQVVDKIKAFDRILESFYKGHKTEYYRLSNGDYTYFPNNDDFEKLKSEYAQVKSQDPEIVSMIEKGDKYFNDFLPNEFIAEFKKGIPSSDMFDSTKWMPEPAIYMSRIDNKLTGDYLKGASKISRDDNWIQEVYNLYINQKTKIENYKKNGGLTAYKEQLEQKDAEKVFPTKSSFTDPEIVAYVKKVHKPDYYGVIQKVIILTDWKIRKDNLNRPIEKYKAIEIITKKDGKCYLISSTVYMEHEGGGKYGVKKLSRYLNNFLMNCNNAK